MVNIHIKSAWDHMRRSPFQALAAVFALTNTFFVITVLSVIVFASNQVIKYFETRPQIIAFLKDDATNERVSDLQNKLESDMRVSQVVYVSKEEALEIYKKATSDNPLLSELVSPAIFPASIEVQVNDLVHADSLIGEIKQDEIVEQVGFTASLGSEATLGEVLQKLRNLTLYLRIGGGVFALMLVSTSFLVLIIIIGMRITTRRGEIEILDLIGATPGFIRKPILWEATLYSLIGVFAGWLAGFVVVLYVTPNLVSYFGDIPFLPRDTFELAKLFGLILFGEMFVGLLLAISGSILAVSRVKKR